MQKGRFHHSEQMNLQVADMVLNTGISLHYLEKEFTFTESLQPSKSKPEYWQNLGSSKSRTKMQETLSREVIGSVLNDCKERTAIAFTDGSCLGNPGPCGAGECIFPPGHTEPSLLKHPVSSYGSILLGELIAIKLAVKHIQSKTTEADLRNTEKLHIFSDTGSLCNWSFGAGMGAKISQIYYPGSTTTTYIQHTTYPF